MILETSHDAPLESPDDGAVARALERLAAGEREWVALCRDRRRRELVSASRGRRGLVVEIVRRRVLRCRTPLPPDRVRRLFLDYARGDTLWQVPLAWRDVTNESLWAWLILVAAVTVSALIVLPKIVVFVRRLAER